MDDFNPGHVTQSTCTGIVGDYTLRTHFKRHDSICLTAVGS